jgi:hypothetical protein
MLRTFQQCVDWRSAVAPVVAIVLISAILLALAAPIVDGRFDRVAFSLPVVVFFLSYRPLRPVGFHLKKLLRERTCT